MEHSHSSQGNISWAGQEIFSIFGAWMFMCSQEYATAPYLEPVESGLKTSILFL